MEQRRERLLSAGAQGTLIVPSSSRRVLMGVSKAEVKGASLGAAESP